MHGAPSLFFLLAVVFPSTSLEAKGGVIAQRKDSISSREKYDGTPTNLVAAVEPKIRRRFRLPILLLHQRKTGSTIMCDHLLLDVTVRETKDSWVKKIRPQ